MLGILFAMVATIPDCVIGRVLLPQPGREVRLNGDVPRLADFRHFTIDADDAFGELHVFGPESEDFAGAQAGPDAGEQT